MISAVLNATLPPEATSSVEQLYARTEALIGALNNDAPEIAPPVDGWFGGIHSPTDSCVSFSARDEMVSRLRQAAGASEIKSLSIALTTGMAAKRKPNQLELHYLPMHGLLRISVYRPTSALSVAGLLSGVATGSIIQFAFVDVYDNAPAPEEPGDKAWYSGTFATFPHRQCLGWMAYVPRQVTREQLPLAADILPAKGGSIIVTTKELFDISNKEHIKRANQIEMDMNDLGLLAMTDLNF